MQVEHFEGRDTRRPKKTDSNAPQGESGGTQQLQLQPPKIIDLYLEWIGRG